MSTLKPYPAYKDSGIEWLGHVPMNWSVIQLRNGARILNGGTPPSGDPACWDGDIPFISPPDLNGLDGSLFSATARCLTLKGAKYSGSAPAGAVMLSTRAPVGHIGISQVASAFNQGCRAILPAESLQGDYLAYLLVAAREFLAASATGTTFQELSGVELSSMRISLPSSEEQRAIADFLDRETAEIDAFVEESEKLITLLRERRAAVITQAVTKGLDPTAPMKDTGIEWLGQIPAHWSLHGISAYVDTWGGAGFPDSEQGLLDEALPFYKVNALGQADPDGVIRAQWDTISRETAVRLRARVVPSDAMLLAKIGAALLLGRIRRVEHECCIDNNMMAVVPHSESINPRFLQWTLQTISMELHVNPGAVPSLNIYSFTHHELAFPPRDEQQRIATHLEAVTAKIDEAIATAREAITLAKERRQALISAAVTGKIDVRAAA